MHRFRPIPEDPQLIHGMPFEEYQALDALNISSLLLMLISPRHFRHGLDNQRPDTEAFRVGRAVHTLVLEREAAFAAGYAVSPYDDFRKKEAREWRDEQERKGKTVLSQKQENHVRAMRTGIYSNRYAKTWLVVGQAEVTITWTDQETGLRCKARLDWLTSQRIIDLKTAQSPDPLWFSKHAFRLDYHTRLAWYQDGLREVTGQHLPVSIIAVEKNPPHDCAFYDMPETALEIGRKKSRRLLLELAECLESDQWPGVAPRQELPIPAWIEEDEELELTMDGESIDL